MRPFIGNGDADNPRILWSRIKGRGFIVGTNVGRIVFKLLVATVKDYRPPHFVLEVYLVDPYRLLARWMFPRWKPSKTPPRGKVYPGR